MLYLHGRLAITDVKSRTNGQLVKKEVHVNRNNKQPWWKNRIHSGCIIFENKTGIPITPYKECMIDGSESPNASKSFDSGSRDGAVVRALASHQCVPGSIIIIIMVIVIIISILILTELVVLHHYSG